MTTLACFAKDLVRNKFYYILELKSYQCFSIQFNISYNKCSYNKRHKLIATKWCSSFSIMYTVKSYRAYSIWTITASEWTLMKQLSLKVTMFSYLPGLWIVWISHQIKWDSRPKNEIEIIVLNEIIFLKHFTGRGKRLWHMYLKYALRSCGNIFKRVINKHGFWKSKKLSYYN